MIDPNSFSSKPNIKLSGHFTESLPGDPITENSCRQVREVMYSFVNPTKVSAPKLVSFSNDVASMLGLSSEWLQSLHGADVLSGNELLPGSSPYACCYGGHQFGHWAGQLGDGRAINLGELTNENGERFELQLKGAGPTPYSRGADGRAVLRSSVREFLMSEAMHHLGISTTRALSLILTGDAITRDMLYDGNPKPEPGAIVCRVASSFLRFGSFEIFAARRDHERLKSLVDFTITNYFPAITSLNQEGYLQWLCEVGERTGRLMAEWMRVGFVHGVMNTDNMSILGLTIDYGPYGWIDNYDPLWTPNTTDAQGRRYRFGQQPQIGLWNFERLVHAVSPLFDGTDFAETALDSFIDAYQNEQSDCYRRKFGLKTFEGDDDIELFQEAFDILKMTETDMTIFFRNLAKVSFESDFTEEQSFQVLLDAYYTSPNRHIKASLVNWLRAYKTRIAKDKDESATRIRRMNSANPKYVLRNYMAQQAIDKAENGNFKEIERLLVILKKPYDEQPEAEAYFQKRPDWARNKPGCSMLSCSS
ncbi:MAG: YdiU family protein [Myxococcota bacterium]|nr:YdiU family protein [Myxococcota bacterium]